MWANCEESIYPACRSEPVECPTLTQVALTFVNEFKNSPVSTVRVILYEEVPWLMISIRLFLIRMRDGIRSSMSSWTASAFCRPSSSQI